MQVGYLVETNIGPYGQPRPDPRTVAGRIEDFLDEALEAERAGFDSFNVPDRHMRTECYFSDPLQLLTAVAARTSRIRLAPHALVLTLRHPMQVAEHAAALDLLSRGRLILALIMGYNDDYWRMFGRSRAQRRNVFEESVEILRRAFEGGRFSYDGTSVSVDDVELTPPPYQTPSPPIWLGGHVDAAAVRAGRLGDGYVGDPMPIDPAAWRRRLALYRETAAEHGRQTKVVVMREAWVAETAADARRAIGDHHVAEHRLYHRFGMYDQVNHPAFRSESDITHESLLPHVVVGSPADCVESLQRLRDDFEVDYVVLRFRQTTGPSHAETLDAIRLFGDAVLPKLSPSALTESPGMYNVRPI